MGKFSIDKGKREVESQDLSYGLTALVSDIPANKEVDLPAERYFRCRDVDDLQKTMERLLNRGVTGIEKNAMRRLIAEKYDWNRIAEQTIEVYRMALAT